MILLVEDDPTTRASCQLQLEGAGFQVKATATAEAARQQLASSAELPDLMLLDIRLPGSSGVELVRELAEEGRLPTTVVVSGEATVGEALEAVRHGVADFLEKPVSSQRLVHTVRCALERYSLRREVASLRRRLDTGNEILGTSEVMDRLRDLLARVAATNVTVLIRGASGTGKELVARALHELGARKRGSMVVVNCAALPAQLIESELFGHVRGAFTDARSDRAGLFEEAHGGTLFLDEIGEMQPPLQARLLRVLEDGMVRRVGSSRDHRVDVRVVAATHQDLEQAVGAGSFRQDLFYRLAQLEIMVPALSERIEDIPLLFRHFLDRACERHQRPALTVADRSVLQQLVRYRWPGNVRELKNLCERLAVLGEEPITVDQLPHAVVANQAAQGPGQGLTTLREVRAHAERTHIIKVLEQTGWNVAATARTLAINRTHLHQKMADLDIARP